MRWQRGVLIGKGAYGAVYEAMTDSGQMIAVKQIALPPSLSNSDAPVLLPLRLFYLYAIFIYFMYLCIILFLIYFTDTSDSKGD